MKKPDRSDICQDGLVVFCSRKDSGFSVVDPVFPADARRKTFAQDSVRTRDGRSAVVHGDAIAAVLDETMGLMALYLRKQLAVSWVPAHGAGKSPMLAIKKGMRPSRVCFPTTTPVSFTAMTNRVCRFFAVLSMSAVVAIQVASGQGVVGGNVGVQQEVTVRQILEPVKPGPPSKPGLHGTFSASANYVFETDLDEGGSLAVNRSSVAAGLENVASNSVMVGLAVEHERSHYGFSGGALEETAALEDATATRFGVNLRRPLNEKWSLFGAMDTTFSVADGTSWGDGRTSGGLISFQRRVTDRFSLSIGLIGHERLEERPMVFPIPGFEWRITDRLALRTAQGLTLSWQVDGRKKWTADFAANYESRSYRLDDDGPLPSGVAKDSRVPLIASVRFAPHPVVSIRFYAGTVVAQRLEFDDSDGSEVETVKADPTLVAGVQVSTRF